MGTGPHRKKHGARSKNKQYKRSLWLKRRDKDIDQVQDELRDSEEKGKTIECEKIIGKSGSTFAAKILKIKL